MQQAGTRPSEGGEPGAVIGEDVGDGNREEIAVGVLDFKLVRAVEAPQFGGGGHLASPEKGAGVLPCLGPVVLALRIGSYHGGLAPFYRYSIVGAIPVLKSGEIVIFSQPVASYEDIITIKRDNTDSYVDGLPFKEGWSANHSQVSPYAVEWKAGLL